MFYSMGIPIDLYTPIFAVSRISGWTAHVLEQYANNRLIRPRTDYIGPPYPQQFLPHRPALAGRRRVCVRRVIGLTNLTNHQGPASVVPCPSP